MPSPTPDFGAHLERLGCGRLTRGPVTTLQVNLTARCNLACHHCHVESGPKRSESLGRADATRILEILAANPTVDTLDLTGGAPEMSDQFRFLVEGARALGRRVIDRCNLTILYVPGYEDLADFLAAQRVEIVASLPCYSLENVDRQRGRGVFDESIRALKDLNRRGYAAPGSGLVLDLIYNPGGPVLPPDQRELEAQYRDELMQRFGIRFDALYTLTNMPIKRFARDLAHSGQETEYMSLLVEHFNPQTVDQLMCRSTLSIGWDGRLYDCDFNQALELPRPEGPAQLADLGDLGDLTDLGALEGQAIATASHCFGCTAGAGSSCRGSLA